MFIVLFQSQNKTFMLVSVPVIVLTGFLSFYLMAAIPFSSLDYNFSLVFISLSLFQEEVSCSYLSCSIRILIRIRGSVCRGICLLSREREDQWDSSLLIVWTFCQRTTNFTLKDRNSIKLDYFRSLDECKNSIAF